MTIKVVRAFYKLKFSDTGVYPPEDPGATESTAQKMLHTTEYYLKTEAEQIKEDLLSMPNVSEIVGWEELDLDEVEL